MVIRALLKPSCAEWLKPSFFPSPYTGPEIGIAADGIVLGNPPQAVAAVGNETHDIHRGSLVDRLGLVGVDQDAGLLEILLDQLEVALVPLGHTLFSELFSLELQVLLGHVAQHNRFIPGRVPLQHNGIIPGRTPGNSRRNPLISAPLWPEPGIGGA